MLNEVSPNRDQEGHLGTWGQRTACLGTGGVVSPACKLAVAINASLSFSN